ncbi:MAG: CehA/McbA family metallohydrolase [Cephaloticoccus sp.]|nr:CehA/McbA family metallohydrolase [Cephaloticoccus sp.]MCF7759638.1 CehA/McbA family metallohydrolase [Cephaloticoccus sp.]
MNIENPYAGMETRQWLRGNLHAHTTASDGRKPIQDVINSYATLGYDFLMISDHDIVTGPADYAKLDPRGLILIPGNEVTRNGPHLLHVGADQRIEPDADRQLVINAINAGPGFAVINHPNWEHDFNHWSFDQLDEWQNYLGMEIFNGTIGRLDGSPYATDKWDRLLSRGRRIWGFANDDSHLPVEDVGLGWNMVGTTDRSVAGLMDAMRRGCFYGSTGVNITAIAVTGNRIRVETENADRILAYHQTGMEFARVDANAIEIEVPTRARYVRFECLGRGGRAAWTQPFYLEAE